MIKELGTHTTQYAHQVIADTGSNKPFELREVSFSVVYDGPNFPGDLDCYRSTILDGAFKGTMIVSDHADDVRGDVDYELMDLSRKLFTATTLTALT